MSHKCRLFLAVCLLAPILCSSYIIAPESHLLFTISAKTKGRLGIVNKSNKNLKVEIVGIDEISLFNKKVSPNNNYFQVLDLSSMPNGEYCVILTAGLEEITEKKFKVQEGIASLVKKPQEVSPVFKVVNNSSLLISYLNANLNSVSIFLEKDEEIVFEDRNIVDMPLSRRYSLSNLPKGPYVVKLYSGGKVYTFSLSL